MTHYFTDNSSLESKLRTIKYEYKGVDFTFLSDIGVFSKNKIDFGSKALMNIILSYEQEDVSNILDVGCGYGVIGIVLSKILNARADLIDVNRRSVHLSQKNIKINDVNAKAMVSNGYENINDKYDIIVTNPPIRAGKQVVLTILKTAKQYLKENGRLWFVIRKDQGAKSIVNSISDIYQVELKKKDGGFYIFCALAIDSK